MSWSHTFVYLLLLFFFFNTLGSKDPEGYYIIIIINDIYKAQTSPLAKAANVPSQLIACPD